MITVYHGSHLPVSQPLVKLGRKNLDFGQGFYVTKIKKQAIAWASIIASRKGKNVAPVVSIYLFDDDSAKQDGVLFKSFETYNIEWLDFVINCRLGKKMPFNTDIIEGGVANDNVIDTVEDYEKGIITAEQALGQLTYKKVNHQLCFHNQYVIDKYLHFIESETYPMEGELR